MKTFRGERRREGCLVFVTPTGFSELPLPLRTDLRNHSPTGFEWGYAGSGPAQLALAICAEVVGDERALQVYQRFKFKVVGRLAHERWELTSTEVRDAINDIDPTEAQQQ
jgi:hypothetical protein